MGKILMKIEGGKLIDCQKRTAAQKRADKARMQDLLDNRSAPGFTGGEDSFFNTHGTLRQQLGPQTDMIVAAAKAQGYTPGPNDVYMPSMCRPNRPGDPIAFFSPGSGARAQMKQRIEKHFGTESEGWVKTKQNFHNKVESTLPKPGLCGDIVEDLYQERVVENPDLLKHEGETKADIVKKHGAASMNDDLVEIR